MWVRTTSSAVHDGWGRLSYCVSVTAPDSIPRLGMVERFAGVYISAVAQSNDCASSVREGKGNQNAKYTTQ
jgi:hypothetical protein